MHERSDTSPRFRPARGGDEVPERAEQLVHGRRLPSGRHGLPRAFVVRDQRERILDAMGQTVAEKGYVATTVADITAAAGVSRTTFYALFADKEACFLATYEAASTILFERVAAAAAEDGPWEDRLQRGVRAFLETLDAEPALSHTCIVEAPAAGDRAIDRVGTAMAAFESLLRREDGEPVLEGAPALAAPFFIGGLYDVVYNRIRSGEGSLAALEPDLVALAKRLLGPAEG